LEKQLKSKVRRCLSASGKDHNKEKETEAKAREVELARMRLENKRPEQEKSID